jgi:hypothetical protein
MKNAENDSVSVTQIIDNETCNPPGKSLIHLLNLFINHHHLIKKCKTI